MTMKKWGIRAAGLLATTALVAIDNASVLAAPAASAAPATSAIEEVIVTSRKRAEVLQEVPESITAFTADVIARANIEHLRDFVDMTPNILVRETFRSNETFLTLRGIASAQGALPPVSIIVDGVQLGSNDFINQDLLDVERIEVLKGPQGALYGQGAIAGAINIVSKQATNDLEGSLKGSYGNANSYRIAGSLSGPIVEDTLFFRVAGMYRDTDGLIKNIRGQRITFSDEGLIRGQLQYRSENLRVSLQGSYADGSGGCCIQDKPPRDANGNLIDIDNTKIPGASSNIIGQEETRFINGSLKIDYDFSGVTLTSISGYADVKQTIFGDADFTATPFIGQDITFKTKVKNQELRLTSNNDGPFEWLFGGFYQDRKETQDITVGAQNAAGTVISPTILRQNLLMNSESWAVFGQGSYKITPDLDVSVSLRYDHDKQDSRDLLNAGPTLKKATFKKLQPKVQLSYQWTDDILAYVTYSEGFRPGGYTQTVKFDNEETQNYEAGFKTTMADGRVNLNASFFHIDYKNQLLSYVVFTSTTALRRTINIPLTSVDGLEIELAAKPIDNLTLNVGAGISDSVIKKVKDDPNLSGEEAAVGKKSPLVPTFTFNASATYEQPITDAMNLVFYAAYQRRGQFFFDLNNTIRTGTKSFIDGKVSLEGEQWSLGIWGKNLTNTRHATNMSITGADLRIPNQPRSYGIEATYKF